jgi:hypothetical protein
MRSVSLGQRLYFAWHLPTVLLVVAALAVAAVMARSLARDHLDARARYLRWSVIGWSSVFASLLSVVAWPYLNAVASVRVEADGTWHLRNYLGIELARVPAAEPRSLRALDLGGLRWGAGHVEVVRASGETLHTVRIGGHTFDRLCASLGYTAEMQREAFGSVTIPAHTFTARGPALASALASR